MFGVLARLRRLRRRLPRVRSAPERPQGRRPGTGSPDRTGRRRCRRVERQHDADGVADGELAADGALGVERDGDLLEARLHLARGDVAGLTRRLAEQLLTGLQVDGGDEVVADDGRDR